MHFDCNQRSISGFLSHLDSLDWYIDSYQSRGRFSPGYGGVCDWRVHKTLHLHILAFFFFHSLCMTAGAAKRCNAAQQNCLNYWMWMHGLVIIRSTKKICLPKIQLFYCFSLFQRRTCSIYMGKNNNKPSIIFFPREKNKKKHPHII